MSEPLPRFTYYPDPLATGAVAPSGNACVCCGRARGFVYQANVYSVQDIEPESICPWCIADGSAAAKLDASFADAHPLLEAGVPEAIVDEVHRRTPGYVSWQGESWLAHCGDACEFHGDASADDIAQASVATKADWMATYDQREADWQWVIDDYRPGGDSALYKFVCRHCGFVRFGWDLS